MIRLITVLLTLAVLMATATTVIAVEPEGWCNCNPEAPACRSICPYPSAADRRAGMGLPLVLASRLPALSIPTTSSALLVA
jgi:hypothetical protein